MKKKKIIFYIYNMREREREREKRCFVDKLRFFFFWELGFGRELIRIDFFPFFRLSI